MTQEPELKAKNGVGWGRILLFASLAANLLIVGLVAGVMLRPDFAGRDNDRRRPPLREMGYGPFGQAFSPADRREIGRALADRAGDLRANREEMRRQMSSFLAVLRATPFDVGAIRAAFADQQSKLLERQEIGQRLLLDRIEAMSDEERAAFADRLEKSLRGSLRR